MRLFCLLIFTTQLISCNSGDNEGESELIACTAVYVYGIRVNLNDSITGEAISTCDVSYSITEGAHIDTNEFTGGISCENITFIRGAGERSGVYDVNIKKSGYELWESIGVIVNNDYCHVVPVVLEAFLVPQN